jgi:hypothetical protein
MTVAELGKDTEGMEWAAGNLLGRDWPVDNQELHQTAKERLEGLTKTLQTQNRKSDAQKMASAVNKLMRRDLVIQLSWQGDADLDLEVKEPIGTLCSFLQRQTPGGGILLGDTLLERWRETYAAAEAFPGEYQVTIRRIWGQPLGSKATLKIIQHQGTPDESVQQETIVFDRTHTLQVVLKEGRRKSLAQVPPPTVHQRKSVARSPSGSEIRNKLLALADPDGYGVNRGMRGGVTSAGMPTDSDFKDSLPSGRQGGGQVVFQGRVTSVPNAMDLAAQAVVSADRRYVRLSLAPVFQTVTTVIPTQIVNVPGIPGGRAPGVP